MKETVGIEPTIGLAAVVTATLLIVPSAHITPAPLPFVELPETVTTAELPPDPACVVSGVTDADQRRALELACLKYGDESGRDPFEVFSTATFGYGRGVFVRRPTGHCGGCGAFTVAVIFRGDEIELVDKLGEYGRFGNGPDEIRFRDVAGRSVIEVDESISMHGYTNRYREYFVVDGGRLELQVCLNYEGSDTGARERASEWTSKPWIANDGTLYFSPHYTKRGEVTPQLYAYAILFDHGRWQRRHAEGTCLDPRAEYE